MENVILLNQDVNKWFDAVLLDFITTNVWNYVIAHSVLKHYCKSVYTEWYANWISKQSTTTMPNAIVYMIDNDT